MTEHTPGPWQHEIWNGLHHTVVDADGETVAFQISTAGNARLVAAAPQMLEALELVEPAITSLLDELAQTQATDWGLVNDCLCAAKRVIVATKGGGQ